MRPASRCLLRPTPYCALPPLTSCKRRTANGSLRSKTSGEARMTHIARGIILIAFVTAALLRPALAEPPKFEVDPSWPKPLPGNWIIGTIGGITVDSRNHIWINQRPSGLDAREKRAVTDPNVKCCVPAPPVIEFDPAGNVVQAWGGDGADYKWGNDGHGIHVDHNNFVWVGDNVATGGHVYKFTRDGKFVLRIGKPGTPTGSNDTQPPRPPGPPQREE